MAGSGPRLEPKVRARMWPGYETGSRQGLGQDLARCQGKLGWDVSLGRGSDWVGDWVGLPRQGLGRVLNLGEDRDQAGAGALVRNGLSLSQGRTRARFI